MLSTLLSAPAWADLSHMSNSPPPVADNPVTQEIIDSGWRRIGGMLTSEGVPDDVARRVFLNLDDASPQGTGPGSWVYEFKSAGDVYYAHARELELTGSKQDVIAEYARAHAFYDVARFPALFTPERQEAYRLEIETFLKLAKLRQLGIEVVRIPFAGKEIVGHLYRDAQRKPAPLIIESGGLDTWKTARPDFKQRLVKEGFAVFAMDMPGTGESQYLEAVDSDRVYSRVIEYFKSRGDVDGTRIGLYFISLSGGFAIKLALTNPNVGAVVNHSGGIDLYYTNPQPIPANSLQRLAAAARRRAVGLGPDGNLDAVYPAFSLARQGLLAPTPKQAPILSIYGTKDELMPIADYRRFLETGVKSDGLIYEGDAHMAWEHQDDLREKSIAWLKKQLRVTD
jgi:pimeloyl-ACP methyl ester carboxylesterase